MRISDWSSDVCSSDLRFLIVCQESRQRLGFGPRIGLDIRLDDRQAQRFRQPARAIKKPFGFLGHVALLEMIDELRRLLALGLAHRFERSEEHTSELQSLMRISYAVFCLKKKKN